MSKKIKKSTDDKLQLGIQTIIANSEAFAFLKNEEELYTLEDIKRDDNSVVKMIKDAEKME
jgi:hypothetical protein